MGGGIIGGRVSIAALSLGMAEGAFDAALKYSKERKQFGQAISPQKIDTFFKSEKEFGNFVQKEMERRQLKNQRKLQDP